MFLYENSYGKNYVLKFQNLHSILLRFIFVLLCMQMCFKILSGMAKSVEGAVCSVSSLFAYAISSETLVCKILGHLL